MITSGFTPQALYVDGDLIDLCVLDYEAQQKHNGAKLHKVRQSIAKLRLAAEEVFNGYSSPVDEDTLRRWAKEASL